MSLQFVTPIPHRISTQAAHMNASESSCHRQRFRPNSIPRHLPGQPHAATRTAGPLFTAYTRPKPFTEPDSFPLRPPLGRGKRVLSIERCARGGGSATCAEIAQTPLPVAPSDDGRSIG